MESAAVELLNTLRTQVFASREHRPTVLRSIDAVEDLLRRLSTQLGAYHERMAALDRAIADEIALRRKAEQKQLVLEEQLRLMNMERFGKRSERWKPDETLQAQLFNEIETILASTGPQDMDSAGTADPVPASILSKTPTKKRRQATSDGKGGREKLPADLPREVTIIDLPEDKKVCACGKALVKIGEETSERLAIKPFEYFVEQTVRYVYAPACTCQKSTVTSAPVPLRILPKSIATPSLLALVIAGKFCDAIPFYRQESIMGKRHGIPVSRATMARWAYEVHQQLTPLADLILSRIRRGAVMHMDETRLRVLHENGQKKTGQSWMWCAAGYGAATAVDDRAKKYVYFHYGGSRRKEVADELLGAFQGVLMSDAYSGYDTPSTRRGVTQAACMAHARRYYIKAAKAEPHREAVQRILAHIKSLYAIEAAEADSAPEDRLKVRQKESKLLMESLDTLVKDEYKSALPSSAFGKALSYTINVWERLQVFLDNPLVPIDNNLAENAIRPFAVGRKNWLFNDQDSGADASALFYTLIETARANAMEPMHYLRFLFACLEKFGPSAMPWDRLLPSPDLRPYGDSIGIPYALG